MEYTQAETLVIKKEKRTRGYKNKPWVWNVSKNVNKKKIGKTAAWPQHNGVCMWAHTHTHTHTFSLSILSFILFGEIISDVGLQNYPYCNNLLCLSLSIEKTFLTFPKSIIPLMLLNHDELGWKSDERKCHETSTAIHFQLSPHQWLFK